jgi:hypothetical protein
LSFGEKAVRFDALFDFPKGAKMSRSLKCLLMTAVAVTALAACSSDKGPGPIGKKEDIAVRNNGMPGAQSAEASAASAPQTGDFSSTVQQGEAIPAPAVAQGQPLSQPSVPQTAMTEPLPNTSPAMEQAVKQQEAASAPMQSPETPPDAARATVAETRPIDEVAPTEPVTTQNAAVTPPSATQPVPAATTPAPQPPAQMNTYPATAAAPTVAPPSAATSPQTAAAQPPVQAPAPAVNVPYPLDKNAPYSPKAIAEAQEKAAASGAPAAGGVNTPQTISSVQAALAGKGAYTGPQTGVMDAEFLNALTKYQAANGLPQGGVNETTLRHLGLIQ